MPISERLHTLPTREPDNGAGSGNSNLEYAVELGRLYALCRDEKLNPDLEAIKSPVIRELISDLDEYTKGWDWPERQAFIMRREQKRYFAERFGLASPSQVAAIWRGAREQKVIETVFLPGRKENLITPDIFRLFRVITHVVGPRESYNDVDWESVRKDVKEVFGDHRIALIIPTEPKKKRRYRPRVGTAFKTVHPSGNVSYDIFSSNDDRESDAEETTDEVKRTAHSPEELQRRQKNKDRFAMMGAISVHRDLEQDQRQVLQTYDRDAIKEIADRLDDCSLIEVEADEAFADIAQLIYITMYVRWAMGSGASEIASKNAESQVNSFEMRKQLRAIEKYMRKNPLVRTLRHYFEELRKWAIDNPDLSAHITPESW
jgi:hypothetical protein